MHYTLLGYALWGAQTSQRLVGGSRRVCPVPHERNPMNERNKREPSWGMYGFFANIMRLVLTILWHDH